MSGQYRIRGQNVEKELTSDMRVAHTFTKQGDCWHNIRARLTLILLLTVCGFAASMVTSESSAQGTSCFPQTTLHTTVPIEIRKHASYWTSYVGKTQRAVTYKVIESKNALLFGSCWVRIPEGWLLRKASSSAIKPGAYGTNTRRNTNVTSSTSTTTTQRCYRGGMAYITGTMNIRSGPSTRNSKVGSAKSGDVLTVSTSEQKDDYCWLNTTKGWIAKTARVQATKPVVPSNAVTYPPIYGEEQFVSRIRRAFDYMARKSARWYNYVRSVTRSIESSESVLGARAYTDSRRMAINSDAFTETMKLASVLVHEACHFYQAIEGRLDSLSRLGRETECVRIQIDFVEEVSPSSTTWMREIQSYLSWSSW